MILPQGTQPFVDFATILRSHGFAISPEQTIGFVEAVGLLGPRSMNDIRSSTLAMLAVPKDREDEFEALYNAFFFGRLLTPPVAGDDDDELQAHDPGSETVNIEVEEDEEDRGDVASGTEVLAQRVFSSVDEPTVLKNFVRAGRRSLPRRLSYRFQNNRHGRKLNIRQLLKSSARTDGDVLTLPMLIRKRRMRKILLLIDVSASMRDQSDSYIRFAHTLAQTASFFECFTLGTRLTRITDALKLKRAEQALSRVTEAVADFDGGTRIGDALDAFLNIPRFVGSARGAYVLILSDGLERGDPAMMVDALKRISRMSWRLHWLSPLGNGAQYKPTTDALLQAADHLDHLSGAADLNVLCENVLMNARAA